jgi:hypothetical protein
MFRLNPLLLLLFLALSVALPAAAQTPAEVTIQAPQAEPATGETFTTDVTIEGVEGLLGFQFDVNFDPQQLAVESIALGPFLGSTGRSPQPLGPDQRDAANGRVVYGGFTLGSQDQAGAAGDGTLAVITWRVLEPGAFQADLSRVQLAGAGGVALPGSDPSQPPPQQASGGEDQAPSNQDGAAGTVQANDDGGLAEESGSASPVAGMPVWLWFVILAVFVGAVAVIVARLRRRPAS